MSKLPFDLFAQDTAVKDDALTVPVEQKESEVMGCDTISAGIPAVVPVGSHGHGHVGFTPSDAALVHSISTDGSARSNLIETSASAKDNLVQVVENRFQTERSVKESELATERSARSSDRELQSVRHEIMSAITSENSRTREMLLSQELTRQTSALADLKSSALTDQLTQIAKKLGIGV